MPTADRRDILSALLGGAGTLGIGVGASTLLGAPSEPGASVSEALATAVAARLSDLAALRTAAAGSTSLTHLFADGATLAYPVGKGRFLCAGDPLRAIALLPLRYRGTVLDLPVVALFAGNTAQGLQLLSLRSGPADPFDPVRSPVTATPNGAIDLQRQYDQLAAAGGGVLAIPPGRFATNLLLHSRHVHLSGAGRGATCLVPRDPAQPVLRALYRDGSWSYVSIANLDIAGVTGRGTGFVAGADSYAPGDEFAGRTRFVNIGFADLDTAIRRQAGQIGLILQQCGFGPADWHIHSTGHTSDQGEIMHAGVLTVRDCHFTGARRAVAYLNSAVPGTGAVLFDNCIMERNPGFVFYVAAFADVEATTDFVVRNCWNEANATANDVLIDGRREPARYASLRDVGMIRFEGTPLGSLTLRNAVVETWHCPLDQLTAVDRDRSSTLRHHEARGFGGYEPLGLALSVAAAAQSDPGGRALTFVLPPRTRQVSLPAADVRMSITGAAPLVLVGSHSVTTQPTREAVLPGMSFSQRVTLRAGMKIFPKPVAIPPGAWIVWLFAYRLVAGSGTFFQVSGDRGISARRSLTADQWETLGGMAQVASGAKEISLWLIQEESSADILLGGYNLIAFADRQAAVEFLNKPDFAVATG